MNIKKRQLPGFLSVTCNLFFATCLALVLVPGLALAQNECGPQLLPGDTLTCAPGDYNDGITYSSVGDLTLEVTDDSDHLDVFENGVSVTGNGTDSVFWDSSAFVNNDIRGTGIVMDYSSVSGDIGIDVGGEIGTQSDATHGIRAISGSGGISIETNGNVGGSTVNLAYGIQSQTGGAGALSIIVLNDINVGNVTGSTGTAIDATTGTGDLVIDMISTGSIDTINGGDVAIRTNAGGNALINVGDGRLVFADTAMDLTAVGQTTVNNNGGRINGGSDVGEFAIVAGDDNDLTDDSLVLTNDNDIDGAMDFSGLSGGYTFTNNGTWNIRQGIATSGASSANRQVVSTLGAGTFINAGTIQFGELEERILAPGTDFTGTGNSLFDMRVTMNGAGQSRCEAATVAGCLDLSGGSTSGQTVILINSVPPPLDPEAGLTTAANPGILLVDVSGGTSAADHFVLHPDTENYLDTSFYGPVITTGGPLVYTLLYNPDAQQHILGSVPTPEGAEYATFIDEVTSIWHTTADAVAGRQADLRGGATGGGWVRLVSERTTRDTTLSMTTHGNSFTFDMGYEQDTRAVLFGFDAAYGDNYVIGLHGGLISSDTDYDGTGNGNEIEAGAAAGIYGGWWRDLGIGQLTVDATVNGNFLTLDHDASYEVTHSDIRSLGVRAEAGWKLPVIDGFYAQPLATFAYVVSNIETMELRQNVISFEDEESQRVALGVRLGGDFEAQSGITARYWLTGRAWDERAEDGRVEYATAGEPLTIADDISGSFEEVGFGASLSNQEDTLSVFASGSTKFIDDVTNYNITVGLRKRW